MNQCHPDGRAPPPAAHQRGIALIAVLLLLVFVLTIVGGLFYRHQIHIQKVTRTLVGEQAVLLLLGAESWARSVLLRDARHSEVDHLEENWAEDLPPMPVEGGVVTGCLRDLQGLYNLNGLGDYTANTWSDELEEEWRSGPRTSRRVFFRELLVHLGLEASDQRIAAVVDWIDPDAWLVSPDSAEDNEYLLLDPPYRAANQPIGDLSELGLVMGFGREDVVRLAPWVNTVPEAVPLNVNTAPLPVLAALSPLLEPSSAEALARQRPFESADAFYQALSATLGETVETLRGAIPPELVDVESAWFALEADIRVAGVRLAYHSVIHRQGDNASRVLRRTVNFVPPLRDDRGRERRVDTLCNRNREATTPT